MKTLTMDNMMTIHIHITTAQQLINISQASKGDFTAVLGYDFILDNDIDLSQYNAQINIGSLPLTGESHPFYGTFDGNGHTISGLTFTDENSSDAGLFAYTNGAVIKNLVIANANIKSARRGGIVAGMAVNTEFYNVTVRDSNIEMFTNGAVIELITGLGISGGVIAGAMQYSPNNNSEASNPNSTHSVMYNCESKNSNVTVNTVAGVQALSGDGLYIGGLCGYSNDSTIEYSRAVGGKVEMRFDIAVGALGGKVLYAGGITGGMGGNSKIIDCFAANDVSISSVNAVTVGSGTIGYVAGIAGAAYGQSALERCHYSGVLYSYLYNAILVIPIPLENQHIYGLVGKNDDSITITSSYFDYDRAMTDKDYNDITIPAVCDREDTADAGAKPREQYISQTFWSKKNYDFSGTIVRNTDSDEIAGNPHYNKWVMDYESEMPVHGKGITAAIDFPDAGTLTIGSSTLRDPISFTNGYHTQIVSVNDNSLELSTAPNNGYNFKGWYKGTIDSSGNISISGDSLSTDSNYTINNPEDNSVYIAHYTANVVFKNPNSGQEDHIDEYTYNQPLKLNNNLFAYDGQTLIGWNTGKTYLNATSDQINSIDFVKADTPVTRPITLYPVFVGVGNNINAVFEQTGTQYATDTRLQTTTGSDNEGWYVSFTYNDTKEAMPDGYMFDGWYQIPYDESIKGNPIKIDNAICVSRDKTYYVNEDYQTEQYLYVAKFKYRVTAWMPVEYESLPTISYFYYRNYSDFQDQGKFTEVWADYGNTSKIIPTPAMGENESFRYWTDDNSIINKQYGTTGSDKLNDINSPAFNSGITQPIDLYGLVNIPYYYDTSVSAFSDFPGAVSITNTYQQGWGLKNDKLNTSVNLSDRYNFKDVLHYEENKFISSNTQLTWDIEINRYDYIQHYILVRAAADVAFHTKEGKLIETDDNFSVYNNPTGLTSSRTVTRKYQSLIFGDTTTPESEFGTEITPGNCFDLIRDSDTPVGIGTAPAIDGNGVKIDNYKFLGWVNKTALRPIDEKYLYDYTDETAQESDSTEEPTASTPEQNVTSDSKKADGYILKADDRVYSYMDIYPLYAKYKVTLTDNLTDSDHTPNNSYTVSDNGIITITPDSSFNSADIKDITGTNSKGETIVLTKNDDGTYKNNSDNLLDVDETYTFTINYEFTVKYNNVKDKNEPVIIKRGYNEPVGETYEPSTSSPEGKVFAGWVNKAPDPGKDYVEYENYSAAVIVTIDTPVTSDLNLYPAYTKPNITTSSNIDTESDKYTGYTVNEGKVTITAEQADGYKFSSWTIVNADGSSKYYAGTSSCELTDNDALSGNEYKALYNPVFTYMIPTIENSGTIEYYEEDSIKDTISYGTEFAGGSSVAIQAVQKAFEDTDYTFAGWTDRKNGETQYTNTSVTAPTTLYPIIKKAITVTYEYKDTNGDTKTYTEKYPSAQNITLIDLGDYSYTDESGTHKFTGWSANNIFYAPDTQYKLTNSVTFTATWSDTAHSYTVWSNISDEITQLSFPESEGTLTFPVSSQLSEIAPSTDSKTTFIGYALVSIDGDQRICYGLYASGDTINKAIIDEYNNSDSNKRIYAVWAQVETLTGAQIRLDQQSGLRVMGIVNTTILERVGLNTPDTSYKRGILFTTDTVLNGLTSSNQNLYSSYMNMSKLSTSDSSVIDATSGKWYGNLHNVTIESSDKNTFSIIAQMDETYYSTNWAYRAYLKFTYQDKDTKYAYGSFNSSNNIRSIKSIAENYIEDLENQGQQHENYLGLGKEAYDLLMKYAGKATANTAQ